MAGSGLRWLGQLALSTAVGCGAGASAPNPPGRAPASEPAATAAADRAQGEPVSARQARAVEPERFPAPLEAAWPASNYGSDALLTPPAPECSRVARQPPPTCGAADPVAALAAAFEPVSLTGAGSPGTRGRAQRRSHQRYAEALKRDRRLWELEGCTAFPPGFVRQLRAEALAACAPQIARLDSVESAQFPRPVRATLSALAFRARLLRFSERVRAPVVLGSRQAMARFLAELPGWVEQHFEWLEAQQAVPHQFAERSYARAVAWWALADAWADIQRASAIRPRIPNELKRDYEGRTQFYGACDAASAPLRTGGVQVFAAALEALSWQGVTSPLASGWLREAVRPAALSKRRPSPFFKVLLPRLELAEKPTARQRLFESMPPYYAEQLVTREDLRDRATLASLLTQGLGPGLRRQLVESRSPSPVQLWALTQLRIRLGLLTHERRQFEWAREHLKLLRASARGGDRQARASRGALPAGDGVEFMSALAETLASGPAGVSQWSSHPAPLFDVTPLRRVAENGIPSELSWLARVAAAELAIAGPADIDRWQQASRELELAKTALEGTPHGSCVASSLREKSDHWSGPWEGTRARCEQAKLRAAEARASGLPPPKDPAAAVRYGPCSTVAFQRQRRLEARSLVDRDCP